MRRRRDPIVLPPSPEERAVLTGLLWCSRALVLAAALAVAVLLFCRL